MAFAPHTGSSVVVTTLAVVALSACDAERHFENGTARLLMAPVGDDTLQEIEVEADSAVDALAFRWGQSGGPDSGVFFMEVRGERAELDCDTVVDRVQVAMEVDRSDAAEPLLASLDVRFDQAELWPEVVGPLASAGDAEHELELLSRGVGRLDVTELRLSSGDEEYSCGGAPDVDHVYSLQLEWDFGAAPRIAHQQPGGYIIADF